MAIVNFHHNKDLRSQFGVGFEAAVAESSLWERQKEVIATKAFAAASSGTAGDFLNSVQKTVKRVDKKG